MGFFNFSLFDFFDKQIDTAELTTIIASAYEQVHFKELALYIAISYIANSLSKCEIKVFKAGEEVKDEWYYTLNVSPNPNQNSSQFLNQIIENYFYNGEALVIPIDDHLYCADSFQILKNSLKGNTFTNIRIGEEQIPENYQSDKVFYFKLDNRQAKSLIDNLYSQYGAVMSAAIAAFKRNSGKKYKLHLENYKAGDKTFQQTFDDVIKGQLKNFMDNDNAVYPQFKGTDLTEIGTQNTANSADIIALRKEIFEVTAQAFKIPTPMMYGNITNMNEIVKVYSSFCVDPLACMFSEEFTRKRNDDYSKWKNGNLIKIDTSSINHVDILDVADKADKLVSSGLFSIDEGRERLGKEPLGTEFGRQHFITKNYITAEQALTEGGEKE